MGIPLLDLKAQYNSIQDELEAAVIDTMRSGQYILGPKVQELENAIATFCNVEFAVGVANGTDALVLTLDAMGIGPGDEVITSSFTFFASAECISRLGATPVFVDIDPDTYNMSPEQLEAKITGKTKAIIAVHIFGQPADMNAINAIAKKHGIKVVEDACQAIGAEYRGRKVGSLADAACFSFFPSKNLGGMGDGGIVVTDNKEIADKVRTLRAHGSSRKYYHNTIGYNSRLDAVQAAILNVKLKYLNKWNDARREKAKIYDGLFVGSKVITPVALDHIKHVYHLYIIRVPERAQVEAVLKEKGIGHGVYYPVPLHMQDIYRESLGYSEGSLPISEVASHETMAVPLYPELKEEDMSTIVDLVKGAV